MTGVLQSHQDAPVRQGGDSAAGVHQCVEDGWVTLAFAGVKGLHDIVIPAPAPVIPAKAPVIPAKAGTSRKFPQSGNVAIIR